MYTSIESMFYNNIQEINKQSKTIIYKEREKGFIANVYEAGDMINDLYISLFKSDNSGTLKVNDNKHFLALCYIKMKDLYRNQFLRDIRMQSLHKKYNIEQELLSISIDVNELNLSESDIIDCIEDLQNDEQKTILKLKLKGLTNEQICKNLGYTRSQLRSKIMYGRRNIFSTLKNKGLINSDVDIKDIIGRDKNDERIEYDEVKMDSIYYYSNYPFDGNYKDKIIFILSKTGSITTQKLSNIFRVNEGKEFSDDIYSAFKNTLKKLSETGDIVILNNDIIPIQCNTK